MIPRIPFCALIFILLASEAQSWCDKPVIPNAKLACTTKEKSGRYVHKTHCRIFCERNYEQEKGPKAIDCFRGFWYISGGGSARYTEPAVCTRSFRGDGRSLLIADTPERHDGMCSTTPCSKRYYGIPQRRCESFNCCWNAKKRECNEYLESKCQVATAKRTICSGTWFGYPRLRCEAKGCCHDPENSRCYTVKANIFPKPDPGKSLPGPDETCGTLSRNLVNGRVECKLKNGILTCSATCHDRFVLVGVSERTCYVNSGESSPGSWRCRREYCPRIPKMLKTFIDCTNNERIGSKCTATCARGYTLQARANSATCMPSGEWSTLTVWRCVEVQCPRINPEDFVSGVSGSSAERATISCTKHRNFGSVCAVNCPLGYINSGDSNTQCQINGEWSYAEFRCSPLRCGPPYVANSVSLHCSDDHNVGSKCDLYCDDGYELIGESSTTCRANQRWSVSSGLVSCEIVRQCERPTVPAGAVLHCTLGNKVGTLCSLTCPEGEQLKGSSVQVVSCLTNLTWDYSYEGESCEGPPRCGALQTEFPDAEWEKLTTVCSGEDNLGSVCTVECGENGDESVVTVCTYNDDNELTWNNPPPSKCINLATQQCDLEVDLATGEYSGIGNYEDYVTIKTAPALPIWRMFRGSGGSKQCNYQSVVMIDYSKLSAFALKLEYEVPSSRHFELTDSPKDARNAKKIIGHNFNMNGVSGFAGKRVFPSKDGIMFTLKKSKTEVAFEAGSADERTIPLDFSDHSALYVGLNRAVHVQHTFDIGRMGSGMCKVCLSFATLE